MDWQDDAILLSVRAYGETSAIAELLTRTNGRHRGLIHGGRSRKMRPILQPGNGVRASWRARLEDHLGTLRLELIKGRAAFLMENPTDLAVLGTVCAHCHLLAEREPHPRLHDALAGFLDYVVHLPHGPQNLQLVAGLLVRFELVVLDECGFGLDLSRCAATETTEDLIYISPKSARAVSGRAGAPYRDRLLPLPKFLVHHSREEGVPSPDAIQDGFKLTGYFLDKHLLAPEGLKLPEPRNRIVQRLTMLPRSKR